MQCSSAPWRELCTWTTGMEWKEQTMENIWPSDFGKGAWTKNAPNSLVSWISTVVRTSSSCEQDKPGRHGLRVALAFRLCSSICAYVCQKLQSACVTKQVEPTKLESVSSVKPLSIEGQLVQHSRETNWQAAIIKRNGVTVLHRDMHRLGKAYFNGQPCWTLAQQEQNCTLHDYLDRVGFWNVPATSPHWCSKLCGEQHSHASKNCHTLYLLATASNHHIRGLLHCSIFVVVSDAIGLEAVQ